MSTVKIDGIQEEPTQQKEELVLIDPKFKDAVVATLGALDIYKSENRMEKVEATAQISEGVTKKVVYYTVKVNGLPIQIIQTIKFFQTQSGYESNIGQILNEENKESN